ncbi:MAG: DNA-formamidopyrimidine glycosylase [Syntrophales bacterium]|nr:DNA-formamidopyrimidine glycosylase [Syntrophales bacterium]
MPELPEIETLCRQLRQVVLFRLIHDVHVFDELIGPVPEIRGRYIREISRSGKFLLFLLDNGYLLRIHLRMTGTLRFLKHLQLVSPYTRMMITFDSGYLTLVDVRRFATLSVEPFWGFATPVEDPPERIVNLFLEGKLSGRKSSIKRFLMDQKIVSGLGNIYVNEILFAAQIHPERAVCRVTKEEWFTLARCTEEILREAVRFGGTTVADWCDLFGRPGLYQYRLRVYGKEGKPCSRCGAVIEKIIADGRGTFYCPRCQV